jgi:hypothetical protein
MTAIIPIPAFADNYIGLLREGGIAAVEGTPARIVDSLSKLRAAAELHAGRRLADCVAAFAEVRAWESAL